MKKNILSQVFRHEQEVNEYCDGYEVGSELRDELGELDNMELARVQVRVRNEHASSEDDDTRCFDNGVFDGYSHNEPEVPEIERPCWHIW